MGWCLENEVDGQGGGGKAEGAGDERGGAISALAIESQVLVGLAFAGHASFCRGEDLGFVGEYAGDAERTVGGREHVFAAEPPPDFLEQPVVRGQGQVGGLDAGGVASASGTADRHHGDVAAMAFGEEERFLRDLVDGIDDAGKAGGEQGFRCAGGEELLDGFDVTCGVDGLGALGHDLDLWLSRGTLDGMDLAVCVRDADLVEINQRERSDAGAGKGFDCPGTDSADSDDADVGLSEGGLFAGAVEALDAAEPGGVGFVGELCCRRVHSAAGP